MPDDETLTPDVTGPESSDPTPDAEPSDAADESDSSSPQLTLEQLQADLAAERQAHARAREGRAGAQRGMEAERTARIAAETAARMFQQQPVHQQREIPPEHRVDESGLSNAEATALNQAQISGDTRTMRDIEARRGRRLTEAASARTRDEIFGAIGQAGSVAQRNQSFEGWLSATNQRASQDPNFGARVGQYYQALQNDPQHAWMDRTPYQAPNGTVVYPHLLKAAVDEAEKEMGTARRTAREDARQSTDAFTEPARGGRGAMPGDNKAKGFSEKTHLNEGERAMVANEKQRDPTYTAAKYFAAMKPDMQSARLKHGRPLRADKYGKPIV